MSEKIIVRMPNWIGDFVMGIPILHDLRHAFPDAQISALTPTHLSSILNKDPHLNHVIGFSRDRRFSPKNSDGSSLIREIRKEKYDIGLLLTNSFSSALHFYLGGVSKRIGFYDSSRRYLLNKGVPFPERRKEQHLVTTYKMLLASLDIEISETRPELFLSDQEIKAAREKIPAGKKVIGINPGAAYGSAKCWIPERFREVARDLLSQDPDRIVLFFGDNGTKELVDRICHKLGNRVINLAGKTSLRELMAFIKISDVFLTNDSGPMHIAAALRVPLVALFGSTNSTVTGPYLNGSVIQKAVSCSPCFKRTCPTDFRCMKQIRSDEVIQILEKVLAKEEGYIVSPSHYKT
jgi:heptosyltransferase-2